MNKASGKLAAGVRKVKTQQKVPVVVEPPVASTSAPASAAAPKRADPVARVNGSALHPARVWPD